VVFEDRLKFSFTARVGALAARLRSCEKNGMRDELVIIDGIIDHEYFMDINQASCSWFEAKAKTRRLIHVYSMGTPGQYKADKPSWNVFRQYSWTLQEY
jgi:hypothetical protein